MTIIYYTARRPPPAAPPAAAGAGRGSAAPLGRHYLFGKRACKMLRMSISNVENSPN